MLATVYLTTGKIAPEFQQASMILCTASESVAIPALWLYCAPIPAGGPDVIHPVGVLTDGHF